MSGSCTLAIPLRQARPYPRRGSCSTRAPIFAAISGVPSEELLSTTKTSVTTSAGRSAKTRPMDRASLCVGMMTDTRTGSWLNSKPWRGRSAPRQQSVNAPGSAGLPHCERQRCNHRNQQFPNPRRAPLRHPQAGQVQKRYSRGRPRQQPNDEQDSESDFGQSLQRSRHRGVTGGGSHDRLPERRSMIMLDVIVDQSGVAVWRVKAFAAILEVDPYEHRPDGQPYDSQSNACLRLRSLLGIVDW